MMRIPGTPKAARCMAAPTEQEADSASDGSQREAAAEHALERDSAAGPTSGILGIRGP